MAAKIQILLSPEQRAQFAHIPVDLPDREIARCYTFSDRDLQLIRYHRRPANRLGFVVQLALLRFPGRTLADVPDVPERVLTHIAEQIPVEPSALASYGERENTRYEHLDELRRLYGYRNCGWPELRSVGAKLSPLALEKP